MVDKINISLLNRTIVSCGMLLILVILSACTTEFSLSSSDSMLQLYSISLDRSETGEYVVDEFQVTYGRITSLDSVQRELELMTVENSSFRIDVVSQFGFRKTFYVDVLYRNPTSRLSRTVVSNNIPLNIRGTIGPIFLPTSGLTSAIELFVDNKLIFRKEPPNKRPKILFFDAEPVVLDGASAYLLKWETKPKNREGYALSIQNKLTNGRFDSILSEENGVNTVIMPNTDYSEIDSILIPAKELYGHKSATLKMAFTDGFFIAVQELAIENLPPKRLELDLKLSNNYTAGQTIVVKISNFYDPITGLGHDHIPDAYSAKWTADGFNISAGTVDMGRLRIDSRNILPGEYNITIHVQNKEIKELYEEKTATLLILP